MEEEKSISIIDKLKPYSDLKFLELHIVELYSTATISEYKILYKTMLKQLQDYCKNKDNE